MSNNKLEEARNAALTAAEAAKAAVEQVTAMSEILKQMTQQNASLLAEKEAMQIQIDSLVRQIAYGMQGTGTVTPNLNTRGKGKKPTQAPFLGVTASQITISTGVMQLIKAVNHDYMFVKFYSTNVDHVIEMRFFEKDEPNSVKIARTNRVSKKETTYTINSTFAVNAVFGAVKPGTSTRHYTVELKKGSTDTVWVYPNLSAFLNGQVLASTRDEIQLSPRIQGKAKLSCTVGRVRFSFPALQLINFGGIERFITVEKIDAETFIVRFSITKKPDSYALTVHNGIQWEVCCKEFEEILGFDVKKHKSMVFSAEKNDDESIIIRRESTKEAK